MTRHVAPASGPLSRRFDVASVRDVPSVTRIETTPDERGRLAADCGISGIDALAADLRVARDGADGLHVTGRVSAEVRQVCVVSLDEFASAIVEPVDLRFAPEAEVDARAAAHAARPAGAEDEGAEDVPDPIVGGRIDLGAVVAEALVLALDPYPRKPGVAFVEPMPPAADEVPDASPFAVLDRFRDDGRG